MTAGMPKPIAAILNADSLCQQIVLFLLENEGAMDTARGIAAWWVRSDQIAVQAALDRLMACGAINAHTLISGTLYGLTQDPEIRTWLRATYGATGRLNRPSSDDDKCLAADSS
jgi:hypothetical protein